MGHSSLRLGSMPFSRPFRVPHELLALQVSRALASISPAALYTILATCGVVMLYLAFRTSLALVGVLVTCMLMLLFAVYLAQWVMAKDEGTVDMQEVCLASPPARLWILGLRSEYDHAVYQLYQQCI